ncbi:MAG: hypothetical protein AVDCRST_MAG13-1139, partial [uncultured Solirubrobacteraceae bacterium]
FVDGLGVTALVAAGVMLVGALAAATLMPGRSPGTVPTAAAPPRVKVGA